MYGLYEWHPYELQAWICGIILGVFYGWYFTVAWYRRKK